MKSKALLLLFTLLLTGCVKRQILVSSDPPGARVQINGRDAGVTPITYDFIVPDAGLFWYHPHVMSAAQVGFGLYGPLLVDDPDDTVKVADELVLVLSDIAMDDDGKMHSADSGGVLAYTPR